MNQEQVKAAIADYEQWYTYTDQGLRLNLAGQDLRGIDFSGLNIQGAIFNAANLAGARFNDASLVDTRFNQASLADACFDGAYLEYAQFVHARLSASFRGANCYHADFSFADLTSAILVETNLQDAKLYQARLDHADLFDTNLAGCDLRNAQMRNTNLIVAGADLRGYLFYAYQSPAGDVVIRAGCRRYLGINRAKAHWRESHQDDPVLQADCLSLVNRIEQIAIARQWIEPVPALPASGTISPEQAQQDFMDCVREIEPTYFVGACTCRIGPYMPEMNQIFIAGVDDCPVHGLGE